LPAPAVPAVLEAPIAAITGDIHEHLIARLRQLAGEIAYTVTFETATRGDGCCQVRESADRDRRAPIPERPGRDARALAEVVYSNLRNACGRSAQLCPFRLIQWPGCGEEGPSDRRRGVSRVA
jgi:hypothetical protein